MKAGSQTCVGTLVMEQIRRLEDLQYILLVRRNLVVALSDTDMLIYPKPLSFLVLGRNSKNFQETQGLENKKTTIITIYFVGEKWFDKFQMK